MEPPDRRGIRRLARDRARSALAGRGLRHRGAARLHEGGRFPSCRPDALQNLFADAGLADPEVRAIDIPTPFPGFDDYWEPFLGGQGAAPAYLMSLDVRRRAYLREILRARLPVQPDGSIPLSARAWAVRATVLA